MMLLQRIAPLPAGDFCPFETPDVEQSIPQRFEQQVRAHGGRLAVRWDRGSYDYAALNATANRLARALLARSRRAPEPVALLFEHGGEALAAIMAVLKAGKIYVVLDPGYPPERLKSMLDDSTARLMVADAQSFDCARQLCGSAIELVRFEEVDRALPGDDLGAYPSPDDLAMIMYTSGSTGGPKGVMHSHRSILADARTHTNGWGMTAHDRSVLAASLSFASSVRTIYSSLLNGAAVFPYDAKKHGFGGLKPWLLDNGITIVRAVPTAFRNFMQTLPGDFVFPSVRVLAVGGEPMLRSDFEHFERHFPPQCVLSHGYGPTETLTVCWVFVPHGAQVTGGKLPIGRCVPGKEVVLLDESRREVSPGEVGEIAVVSRYLSPGYWRDAERTREVFLPDPEGGDARTYLTGDLGRRAADGILVHVGRRDFQVKVRGYRVEVSEVENALRAMPGIRDAVVVGRESEPGKVHLVAYFVASGEPPIAVRFLREHLAQTLPDYMVPSAFLAMEAIPQTPNGKTDRLRLPPPTFVQRDPDRPLKPPRNGLEAELVAMWEEILGVEQLGIDDDFLSLGGDSLHASRIAARVAARFGVEVPAIAALQFETVAKLAEALPPATAGRATHAVT